MGTRNALTLTAAMLYCLADVDATWTAPQIGMGWQACALATRRSERIRTDTRATPQWELTFDTVPDVTTPNVPARELVLDLVAPDDIPTLMNAMHANTGTSSATSTVRTALLNTFASMSRAD
ncbi:Glycoside-hydrolase family GH114 TIM-barrel domain-containing protein [Plasmodiophora brassicae]